MGSFVTTVEKFTKISPSPLNFFSSNWANGPYLFCAVRVREVYGGMPWRVVLLWNFNTLLQGIVNGGPLTIQECVFQSLKRLRQGLSRA